MSHLHAAHYADGATFRTVEIVENVPLARDTWRVRFLLPEMARRFVPGQFLMLRLAGWEDPLLGRPLALYDTVLDGAGKPVGVDVVYLVLGKLTIRLAQLGPGAKLDVWGPLGNGFPADAAHGVEHLILVAGGIGQTPFLALAQECLGRRQYGEPIRQSAAAQRITLCYGARRGEYLAGIADFRRLGVEVYTSTDDGSAGHHGLVTDLLRQVLASGGTGSTSRSGLWPEAAHSGLPAAPSGQRPDLLAAETRRIICCGPEPMMHAVAEIAAAERIECLASLETPMACGLGICFSCVAKIRQPDGEWDYRRTCVEGPIFDAAQIVW